MKRRDELAENPPSKVQKIESGNNWIEAFHAFVDALDTELFEETLSILDELLKDSHFDPIEAIYYAVKAGKVSLVKILLSDNRVNPAVNNNQLFIKACKQGQVDVVKLLLEDPRVSPDALDNEALFVACQEGKIDIVRLLLADERVSFNPEDIDEDFLTIAVDSMNAELIQILLEDEREMPKSFITTALFKACDLGFSEGVQLLLNAQGTRSYSDSDLEEDAETPLRIAAGRGHADTVSLLLKKSNFWEGHVPDAFVTACGEDNVDVVELLMNHLMIAPEDYNFGMRIVTTRGFLKSLEVLLNNPSADPSSWLHIIDDSQQKIHIVKVAYDNEHFHLVKRLLEDQRVVDSLDKAFVYQILREGDPELRASMSKFMANKLFSTNPFISYGLFGTLNQEPLYLPTEIIPNIFQYTQLLIEEDNEEPTPVSFYPG